VTEAVTVPTISCGAGPHCDGQVLVTYDLLGLSAWSPKFAKKYADLGAEMKKSINQFSSDVKNKKFPTA